MDKPILFYENGQPVYSPPGPFYLIDHEPECGDIVENFIRREAAKADNRRPREVEGGGLVVLAIGLLILGVAALLRWGLS